MPKRTDIKSILIIGSGPIVIGQACEFDYAGTQAVKALKTEGYKIILVNSNPATIMTDPDKADVTYIEPITRDVLTQVIACEKPDAILPTLGGQMALNAALDLANEGILEKYQVELIGASIQAIHLAENRDLFRSLMKKIGLDVPFALELDDFVKAKETSKQIKFPVIIRSSYALGGNGAAFIKTAADFLEFTKDAFQADPKQILTIDEALIGWKEFELEVIRDKKDNCIVVCGVENFDPLGIHTGDSITVAPIQTLTDKEYQTMRQAAFAILKAVGVDTGGSNVQFAVNPATGQMVVIEMNPRVSRSSALASKASGFPIAKIAAKLAVGYTLNELKNDITGDQLPASFEPSLDYVVVKIPRFNAEKFSDHFSRGPKMHSVGEVMAVGRTFEESLQKAMRSLEIGQDGFGTLYADEDVASLRKLLRESGPYQLWAIGEAIRKGIALSEIAEITHIDPWFLAAIASIIATEYEIKKLTLENLTPSLLKRYKQLGFSDSRLATLLKGSTHKINHCRNEWKIFPTYKRIDSCAGEFETETAYLYSTYEQICEANPTQNKKILIIGSGPIRIGQGIEFDYCCVHAAKTLRALGFETIMLNCNPETISTDYDEVNRLYVAPLTFEDVMAIIQLEKPRGVFLQFGGQTPLQLAEKLAEVNVPLMGMNIDVIEATENRQKFKQLLQHLNLQQPQNCSVYAAKEGIKTAIEFGFPLIVRPSFVLGGAAMAIVNDMEQLTKCLTKAFNLNPHHPILIEKFLQNAIEIDVDAVTDGQHVFIPGLLEHIEAAGIHSGDSACVIPPIKTSTALQRIIKDQVKQIANHLKIKGLFNVQFAVQENEIYVLEVNPRASRTLPFLCKAVNLPLVDMAVRAILSEEPSSLGLLATPYIPFYCVKEVVLPFDKFPLTPAILGPEMKSTGEVMGIGESFDSAYAKAQIAAGNVLPKLGTVWIVQEHGEEACDLLAEELARLGFQISFDKEPPEKCALVIAINNFSQLSTSIIHAIRFAIAHKICHVTTINAAKALVGAIAYQQKNAILPIAALQECFKKISYLKKPQHFLTGEELSSHQLSHLLQHALSLKKTRNQKNESQLQGRTLALLFDKPSLRTRFSFSIAMQELGGYVIESTSNTRKNELPEDQARVLSGYCHALMVRTHEDEVLKKMSTVAKIPIINGLANLHHPCQILADLLTLLEIFGSLKGLTISYIGDGNNILHSLLLLAPQLQVNINFCCPFSRGPDPDILARAYARMPNNTHIQTFAQPKAAVRNAHAIYTDVWTSMGHEKKSAEHLFVGFQVDEALLSSALPQTVFMHCLPMERGKEVSETLPDHPASVIFDQSENRLHVQKALLLHLLT